MLIKKEMSICEFEAWSGAKTTLDTIIANNKETEFECLIEECYPNGLTDTELNDLLWFNNDWIYEQLGISDEEEEDEDDEDEEEEE